MRIGKEVFRSVFVVSLLIGFAPVYAQWVKTNGPDNVRVLFTEINDPGEITSSAIFAGANGGIFRSYDSGTTWASGSGIPNSPVTAITASNDTLFAGTLGGGVFRSTDTGSTWMAVNSGLQNLSVHALAASNSILYAGTDSGVFRSTNTGASWEAMNTGLVNSSIRALVASGATLFAGTMGGGVFRITSSMNWQAINPGLTSLNVRAVVNIGDIAAATDSGVFRVYGGSANPTWTAVNAGLTNRDVRALAFVPLLFGTAVAGTAAGVYRADNFAATPPGNWSPINEGLTDLDVRDVTFSISGSLYAGTNGGIWRYGGIYPGSIRSRDASPVHFRIGSTGSVYFTLRSPTRVTLTAYTPSGRKVAVLLSEEFPAGSHAHRVGTSAAILPAGLYVYRLRIGSSSETKTVVRNL